MSLLDLREGTIPQKLAAALGADIRATCSRRRTAQAAENKRRELTPELVEALVRELVEAAAHAMLGPFPNKVAGRGAPADNARIILAHDVCQALRGLGLSAGTRFTAPHQSFAVELYLTIASRIWPGVVANPRSTFKRMKDAEITQN
jgi:hypothetical protein